MRIIPKQLVAYTGVMALGALGLFGAVNHAQMNATGHERMWTEVETVLAMTPAQKDEAQTAFDQARVAARPIRQELKGTTQALKAAIRSDSMDQIRSLSATEGQEIGQLAAIRSSALAKVYKTLNPDQRTRADALQKILMQSFRHDVSGAGSRTAS